MLDRLSRKPLAVFFLVACQLFGCVPRRQISTGLSSEVGLGGLVLQEKLAAQYAKYKKAQDALLEGESTNLGPMTRESWENLLATNSSETLTLEERFTLSQMHQEMVIRARSEALERSIIDVNRVRAENKEKEFCAQLPKGGMLHVHPYGTLDDQTVEEILNVADPVLGFKALAQQLQTPGTPQGILYDTELQFLQTASDKYGETAHYHEMTHDDKAALKALFFLPPGNHSFDRFNGVFTVISKFTFSNQAVDPEPLMYRSFFARAKAQHLDYAEITTFIRPTQQWIGSLVPWAAKVKADFGVTVRLLAAFNRTKPVAFTRSKVKQLIELPPSNILVGVNLLADETAAPALEQGQSLYVPLLAAVRSGHSKLHRSIHSGELGDARNPRDSILMGAERIGHGVKLAEDVVALEYARLQRLPVEVNLISNLRLKVVEDLKTHPFLTFLRLGLPVSLSTDDEGIFRSTISDECIAAITNSDVTYAELKDMSFNSIKTSFAEEVQKAELLTSLTKSFAEFESSWQAFSRAVAPQ